MRVSVIQFAAGTDPAGNLDTIGGLVRVAGRQGADLVVVPEAAMHDFGAPDLPLGPVAEAVDGPFVSTVGELAREVGATVVVGMFEASDDPARPYNTLVTLSPEGELVATYRKVHLYDSFGYRESDRLLGGDIDLVTVDVAGMRVGLQTCYDLRFPEFSRALVDAGAEVLVVPAAWVRGPLKEDHWVTLARARAIENTVYVAAAAQAPPSYSGRSMVIDPMGVVLSALGDGEGVATADLDPQRMKEMRDRNPSLANRRMRSMP